MEQFRKLFNEGLDMANFSLDEEKLKKFYLYYQILIEWNQKMNLTAITDMKEVITKHFIDSLMVFGVVPRIQSLKALDLGTGAGFPGLPLKIAEPSLKIVLVDSLRKRIDFLNHVVQALELTDIKALHARAEEFGKNIEHREQYDLTFSRAVARLNILSEYCLPFVKIGGKFISLKGPNVRDEINEAEKALKELGGEVSEVKEFTLPNSQEQRTILVIEKIKRTPIKFPRKAGIPEKRPL